MAFAACPTLFFIELDTIHDMCSEPWVVTEGDLQIILFREGRESPPSVGLWQKDLNHASSSSLGLLVWSCFYNWRVIFEAKFGVPSTAAEIRICLAYLTFCINTVK